MPKEKDLLDELLEAEDDDDAGEETDAEKAMKAEIEALKKENHGLLTTVKKERSKRQNSDGRLEQLTATVNDIIATNKEKSVASDTQNADESKGLSVLYDDDGNPYLPTESLNTLLTQQQQEINELKEALQITSVNQNAQLEAEKAKMAIVGKNEAFGPVYNKYQSARSWVEKKVDEWQQETGNVGKQVMSGYALDNIFDDSLREEFAKSFPEMDLFTVITAEDSYTQFENMLKSGIHSDEKTEFKKPDSRFQQVINKPSTLGKTANAKTEPTLSEKAGSLSAEDLVNLTDAQIAALEKAMRQEEDNEGIKF